MWDLPRPGLEPVSPALAGRFSTTAPPGKPRCFFKAWAIESFCAWLCLPLSASQLLRTWQRPWRWPSCKMEGAGSLNHWLEDSAVNTSLDCDGLCMDVQWIVLSHWELSGYAARHSAGWHTVYQSLSLLQAHATSVPCTKKKWSSVFKEMEDTILVW